MIDAIVGLGWLALNLALLRIAWEVTRDYLLEDKFSQHITRAVVLMWSCVVVICFLLGTLGALKPIWMAATATVLGCLGAVWVSQRPYSKRYIGQPGGWDNEFRQGKVDSWGWIGFAAFVVASVIIQGVLRFPTDWDSLMYHIPLIDHWLQVGSLYAPDCAVWSFPGNFEILGLWLVAPFSGDFWLGLATLPEALLFIWGTVEIGRQLGLSRRMRNAAGVSGFATHVFIYQIASSENDIAAAGLFVTGIAYGIRAIRSGRQSELTIGALSLGLLAGVKYYALGYAGVAWVGLFLFSVVRRGPLKSLSVVGAFALAALCLAGYWYLRNYSFTGSPVYPLDASKLTEGVEGIRTGSWNTSLLANAGAMTISLWLAAVWQQAGPSHWTAALSIPLTAVWLSVSGLYAVFRPARRECPGELRLLLAVLLLGSLLTFCITPNVVVPNSNGRDIFPYLSVRFSQCPLALAVLALAVTLVDLTRWLESWRQSNTRVLGCILRTPSIAFVGLVGVQLAFHLYVIVVDQPSWILILAAGLFGLCLLMTKYFSANTRRLFIFIAIIAGSLVTSAVLSHRWHRDFAAYYDQLFYTNAFSYLGQIEAGSPVIGVVDYRCYPFFGSRRRLRVVRPAKILSEASLIKFLAGHRIDIVSVQSEDDPARAGRYRGAGNWARNNPQHLTELFKGKNFEVYRVNKAAISRCAAMLP